MVPPLANTLTKTSQCTAASHLQQGLGLRGPSGHLLGCCLCSLLRDIHGPPGAGAARPLCASLGWHHTGLQALPVGTRRQKGPRCIGNKRLSTWLGNAHSILCHGRRPA